MDKQDTREAFRDAARKWTCPQCKAKYGNPCLRRNGKPRVSVHQARADKLIARLASRGHRWAQTGPGPVVPASGGTTAESRSAGRRREDKEWAARSGPVVHNTLQQRAFGDPTEIDPSNNLSMQVPQRAAQFGATAGRARL